MKRCGKCGKENNDEMRFCLECGSQLADAPFVVNLQNDPTTQQQSSVRTDNFGQQQFGSQSSGSQSGNQYVPPNYPTGNRGGGKSNTKIFLAVGGVVALLLLLFAGVAAIVAYNVMNKEKVELVTPSPSPVSNRTVTKDSPTPASSATPKNSPGSNTRTSTLNNDDDKTEDDPNITVKFDGVDVDYNVTEDGKKGMRMRTNFTVSGMKGKDGYLAIHFQNRDGDPLKANPGEYRDVNGNLAAFQTLKPDYDDTVYKDLDLFLPYDEMDLPVGKHDLRMDIDLLDGKGNTLEHMAYENFWYEQK